MAHMPEDEQARQRRLDLERITAHYADAHRAGLKPRIDEYVDRYPQFERELLDFALYFHTMTVGLPEPDALPAPNPSPAVRRALDRIRELAAATPANGEAASPATHADTGTSLTGLVRRGLELGIAPPQLAEHVGLSPDLLGKLEAHVIAAATIPRTLVQRLASILRVTEEATAAFLGITPAAGGAFYYAEQPPTQQQQLFLEAVRSSTLAPERQREWHEIVARDQTAG